MDGQHFDILLRSWSRSPSRRSALRLLVGVALLGRLPGHEAAEVAAHDLLSKCKEKSGKQKKACVKKAKAHRATHTSPPLSPPLSPPPPACVAASDCDDGIACTADACAANGSCLHTPNDTLCAANQVCDRVEGCRCRTGFRHCSGTPADGCECATPCCPAGSCETVHANGVGQTFNDCVPLRTYNQTQAEKARDAHAAVAGAGQTEFFICGTPDINVLCHKIAGQSCSCWAYAGDRAGHVFPGPANFCSCPQTGDPEWT